MSKLISKTTTPSRIASRTADAAMNSNPLRHRIYGTKNLPVYANIPSSPCIFGGAFVSGCPSQRSTFSRRVPKKAWQCKSVLGIAFIAVRLSVESASTKSRVITIILHPNREKGNETITQERTVYREISAPTTLRFLSTPRRFPIRSPEHQMAQRSRL